MARAACSSEPRERGEGGDGWRKKELLTGGPGLSAGERGGEVGARVLGRLGPSRPKTRVEGIDGWISFLFLTHFQKH